MIMDWKPLTMLPCDDRTARERCQGPRRLQEKATPQSRSPADGADGCRGEGCAGVCGGVEGEVGVGMRVEVGRRGHKRSAEASSRGVRRMSGTPPAPAGRSAAPYLLRVY